MISYIKGTIKYKDANSLVVETGGVGYQIFVTLEMLFKLKINDIAELYTYQYVREDALNLYGFATMAELELFKQLLSVSGVGPKSGLGILSIASVDNIRGAIRRGDAAMLTKVSGVGKKTAERVVLELKGKMAEAKGGEKEDGVDGEVIDALVGLGYKVYQAREAVRLIDSEVKGVNARLKAVLKSLSRNM